MSLLSVVLAPIGLAVWILLLRRLPRESDGGVRFRSYRIGDVIFAGILSGLFILPIYAATGKQPIEISSQTVFDAGVFYCFLVAMILTYMAMRGINPLRMFGLVQQRWTYCAIIGAIGILALFPIVALAGDFSRTYLFPTAGGDRTIAYLRDEASLSDWLLISSLALVVAPVGEEVIFRGYLYGVIRQYGGRLAALVVTSILFAGIHLSLTGLLPLFVLALGLALAYELTKSLWVSIAMHSLFNAANLLLLAFFPEAAG